jgi:uncharacterized protein YjiS (DUF1127 family)
MSVYDTNPRPLPLGTLTVHRAVSAVEHMLARLAAWHSARLTAAALHELSDEQLADIGLNRGEIREIAGTLAGR